MFFLHLQVILVTQKVITFPPNNLALQKSRQLVGTVSFSEQRSSVSCVPREGEDLQEVWGTFWSLHGRAIPESGATACCWDQLCAPSTYPELAAVAVVELQDVAFHLHRGQGRLLPGQGGTVVVGATLLQLQDRGSRHWGGN